MRVLTINYEFPPIGGGGGNANKNICRGLAELGVEVFALTAHYKGLPKRTIIDGYTVFRTLSFRRRPDRCSIKEMFAFLFCNIYPSLRLAKGLKPDLVHIHFALPVGPLGYLIKKVYDIPYIITLHGGGIPGFAPERTALLFTFLLPFTRHIWREASAVVAVSQGLKDLAHISYPDTEIQVIRNGIDSQQFQPRSQPDLNRGKVAILFVGRLAEQKGLRYLLQTLPLLHESAETPFELRILGDGPQRQEMESMVERMRLTNLVHFVGWVPSEEVKAYLQDSDIFVLPSLIEGLPISVLEAMACGLPVVTTDTRGNNELVRSGENGFLVPVGDVESLATSLRVLIADLSLRKAMGERGRLVAAEHDWGVISRSYLALYRSVLDGAGHASR